MTSVNPSKFNINNLPKIFWLALLLKLVIAAWLPLTADEAYYWVWAKNLQISYFDHPPVVAWLYWLGQWFDFFPGSVRWPGVIVGHGSIIIWFIILAKFLSPRQMQLWLWLALLNPMTGPGSILVTPDLPLMFFWALGTWQYLRWYYEPTPQNGFWLGLMCGLAFASKYIAGLLPILVLAHVFLSSNRRQALGSSLLPATFAFFLGSLPVWIWNINNGLASLHFQFDHGLGSTIWKPRWTIQYVFGQIAIIFPLVLYWAARGTKQAPKWLALFAWAPLAFFFFTTFKGKVEANWPIIVYPAVLALAALGINEASRMSRWSLRSLLAVWTIAILFILSQVRATNISYGSKKLKTREFNEFDELIEPTRQLSPLFARSYQMAAKLSFEQKRMVYKLKGINRVDFYDFIKESEPTSGRYYFIMEQTDPFPETYLEKGHTVSSHLYIGDRFIIVEVNAP